MRYVYDLNPRIYDHILGVYRQVVHRYELDTIPDELREIFRDYFLDCCESAINYGQMADMYELACSYVGEWTAEEDYILANKLRNMDPSHPFIRKIEEIIDSLHEIPEALDLEQVLPDLYCYMLPEKMLMQLRAEVFKSVGIREDDIHTFIELKIDSRVVVVNVETSLRPRP